MSSSMKKRHLYIVKHEVMATSLTEAARIAMGTVVEAYKAAAEFQPKEEVKVEGFTSPKK